MALNGLRGGRKMGVRGGGVGGRGDLHWSGGTSAPTPVHVRAHNAKPGQGSEIRGPRVGVGGGGLTAAPPELMRRGLGIGGSC